jgi:hypothetical protein
MHVGDTLINLSPRLPWKVSYPLRRALGTLPDFLLAGFPKCGTTSLYHYLIQHPNILSGAAKEMWFFSNPPNTRTFGWYKSQYPYQLDRFIAALVNKRLICGDASPDYLFKQSSIDTLTKTLPDAKYVVLVRNPVERSYSYFQHETRAGRIALPFDTLVEKEYEYFQKHGIAGHEQLYDHPALKDTFLLGSLYSVYVGNLLKKIKRKQLLILSAEQLFVSPHKVFKKVCDFLELDQAEGISFKARNVGGYKAVEIPMRSFLEEFYAPYNRELEKLTGETFNWS